MQIRSKILISSISLLLMAFQSPKLVYIEQANGNESILYDANSRHVNIFIDSKLVATKSIREGIKLYLASYLVKNNTVISSDFKKCYKMSIKAFGGQHKQLISNVIYNLEREDGGNLPKYYKMDAYDLLDIKELKPEITVIKKKLYKSGMIQIDVSGKLEDMPELSPTKKNDSTKPKQ